MPLPLSLSSFLSRRKAKEGGIPETQNGGNSGAEVNAPLAPASPEQLWDRAYDNLNAEDPALIRTYEKIL